MKWERVCKSHEILGPSVSTLRERTPTGWLVLYREFKGSADWAMHDILFVPDPEGKWDITIDCPSWEKIYEHPSSANFKQNTYRMKTSGGWLVLDTYFLRREPHHSHVSMTYVPDEEHRWDIKE
jgi:hypothetical protein